MVKVRFTDPAMEDLVRLKKRDPSALRQILKKILLLQNNPFAGEPLVGELIKYRKLTVGDRQWRIVWIPKQEQSGNQVIEIAEIWAIGVREDSEVYEEMKSRIDSLPQSPRTTSLKEVVEALGKAAGGLMSPEEPTKQAMPTWLQNKLRTDLGLSVDETDAMSVEEAKELWFEFIRHAK